jgi:NAD-dependent SIR2 family protein deacetylase
MNAQPNPAHLAIAAMATLVPKLTLFTQNVDDPHERAGSREVLKWEIKHTVRKKRRPLLEPHFIDEYATRIILMTGCQGGPTTVDRGFAPCQAIRRRI